LSSAAKDRSGGCAGGPVGVAASRQATGGAGGGDSRPDAAVVRRGNRGGEARGNAGTDGCGGGTVLARGESCEVEDSWMTMTDTPSEWVRWCRYGRSPWENRVTERWKKLLS